MINIDDTEATPPYPVAGESAQARSDRERLERTERMRRLAPYLASVGAFLAIAAFFLVLWMIADARIAAVRAARGDRYVMTLLLRLPQEVIYWDHGAEGERRVGAKMK